MSHVYHPPIAEAGLADDCERCAQHAEDLVSLDNDNLRALYGRVMGMRASAGSARSETEGRAMRNLDRVLTVMDRLRSVPR